MKPGFKFSRLTISLTAILCCNWCVVPECSAVGNTGDIIGVLGVFSTIFAGSQHASALPPSLFQKRLGSPMPQIGGPISMDDDDDDSDEDEEDLLDDESQPRVEPHITPLNRDQCLAKLLCGMSVPVTGGTSKKNYYNEYANIVSKFFEAFPPDDELQSKESIETYDDYSTEDDGKPTRMNSRRKPLNSSRVEATAPTLQLFDLALVDVAKPEEMTKNRTRKATFEKRIARARRIVENLGQKLQTVRQCQSIAGCPFSFKQLREKIKKKEKQRVNSNVPLQPGPVWPVSPNRKNEPTPASFESKPYVKPQSRPRPLPPTSKPESTELFSPEEPAFPFKDTHKGDDEMEEIFGPAPISKKPMGYHQGVDEQYNYEYNPDKPWRPGAGGGNSYSHMPWKTHRPRPQPKPFSRPTNNNNGGHGQHSNQRLPPRPRPPPRGPPSSQKRYPQQNHQQNSQHNAQQHHNNRRPASPPPGAQPRPKKPAPPSPTTTRSPFPKKKISYLNSPYKRPGSSGEDDEGNEDINKVAPVELIGNSDADETEPVFKKPTTTTTEKPQEVTESSSSSSSKKKKKNNDEDSDEYDDDDYDDDYEDDDALDDEDEDEYSEEEAEDKEAEAKKKKIKEKKEKRKKQAKEKSKKKKKEEKNEEEEEEEEDDKQAKKKTTTTPAPKKKANVGSQYFDDETEDVHEIWTKLNFATTGGNQQLLEKAKKKKKTSPPKEEKEEQEDTIAEAASEEDDTEADDAEEEEEEVSKSSKGGLQQTRTSSSSASNEDDADDEVDEENASKPKRSKKYKTKTKSKSKVKSEQSEEDEEMAADDIVEAASPAEAPTKQETRTKDTKSKQINKKDKKKKKKKKDGSSEEDDAARRKQFMLEMIGGRPLVPKPEADQANTKKTSSLIANRFKFQFINPYGPAPPSDQNLPGAYTPMRSSFGPTPATSSQSSMGSAAAAAVSSLPFKFKLNPGALGNLAGGAGMVPLGGFPNLGSSSSASGSLELPDPNHPPPPSGYFPPPSQKSQSQQHQQRQDHFGHQSSMSGLGGSNLFKLNPLPALANFFKRPSSGFDPLNGPNGPPPANAFVHRPIGPESSQFNRNRPSPASGSSNPKPASSSSTGGGSKKSSKGRSSSKGRKEKTSGTGLKL